MSPRSSSSSFASLLVAFVACTTDPADPPDAFDSGTGSGTGATTGSLQPTSGSSVSSTSTGTTTSTSSSTSTGMGGSGGSGGTGGGGTGGHTPGAGTPLYPSCACVIDQSGPGFCSTCVSDILTAPADNMQCGSLVTACIGTCKTILDAVLACDDLATGEVCLDMAASLDTDPAVLDDVQDVISCLCSACSACDAGTCQ